MPPWLRRGLEAALVAAVVAIASLWGDRLSAGAPYPFPGGPAGALQVAPAVLAIGVLTTAYPVAMAATRGDAVMGRPWPSTSVTGSSVTAGCRSTGPASLSLGGFCVR